MTGGRNSRSLRGKIAIGTTVLGLVIVLFAGGFAYDQSRKNAPVPATASDFTFTEPPLPDDGVVRLAVIGDAVSKGTPKNTTVWPEIVAHERGWELTNAAGGGGGYVNGLPKHRAFADKLNEAVRNTPEIVVVAGSRNDSNAAPAVVAKEALALLTDLTTRLPESQVIVVGPIWDYKKPTPEVLAVNESVRQAANQLGLTFVDAIAANWLSTPGLLQGDTAHPTDAGQKVIAEQMNAVLPEIETPAPPVEAK
ncbi:hypothetical protein BH683_010830 [Williamsia sp. 1138]|uniref:SGNH/GDSL hydrolase family protein n=1 Tax=Williamsia sp. 1138 TaxID=1903117 RepID=UPI000A105FC3|nr:SGNH/GDSL hydrolase family protein [Williamsia sp. 1138]OZG29153.1 hypothetical protein BH683_010830 [Williamsia sp. 1138]